MYNLNKKNVCLVLAIGFFLIAGLNSVYGDREYEYENSYNDEYEDSYNDEYEQDYTDRSELDQDSDIDLNDVRQNNKNGDNYIIVENQQESITDKVFNFADKIFSDNDPEGYIKSQYSKQDHYEYDGTTNFKVKVVVAFNDRYDDIPDLKVTANGQKKNLNANDLERSSDGYLIYETKFNFQDINKEKIKVCILPDNAPDNFGNCKSVKVQEGDQKTLRFFIS